MSKKIEQFLESKQYLNDECVKVAKLADENSWLTRRVVTYVTENYTGIDQFLVLWVVMNHHWMNEEQDDFVMEMDEHFNKTIERWTTPSEIRDEEIFVSSAINGILMIPTKY